MNKKIAFLTSALLATSLMSCDSDSNDDSWTVYSRNMMVAIADQSGETEYTATAAGYFINKEQPSLGRLAFVALNKPDGSELSMPTCSNMVVENLSENQGYLFRTGMQTQFTGFANDIPMSVSSKLSGRIWTSSQTTNASVSMTFSNGTQLAGFGGDLSFYTYATVTDSENPSEQLSTSNESSNIVRIVMNPSTTERTADICIYNVCLSKNDTQKFNMMMDDVPFDIDATDGTITFRTAETTPYKLINDIKGELLNAYKITDMECMLTVGFDGICDLNFTCGDRYKFTAMLTESL